ncbi:MAG TPA: hypothetical protein VKS60_00770 [Stellaceae bacterium]|nr:hypothetical protein [Stellaceae bacterium]
MTVADTPVESPGGEVSRTSEAIRQEVVFQASPERAYRTLTLADEFDKAGQISEAVRSGLVL